MSDQTAQPPPSKFFGLPALIAIFAVMGGGAYLLTHRSKPHSPSAREPALPLTAVAHAPVFETHSGPASPRLPSDSKYSHALGAWCSYANDFPVFFCGKDQAACEATGPGSQCIQGGPTLWCLERFDANDSIDRADCYWTRTACSAAQIKEKEASTLRVPCQELSRH